MVRTMVCLTWAALFLLSAFSSYGGEGKGFSSITASVEYPVKETRKKRIQGVPDRYPSLPVTLDEAIAAASGRVPGIIKKVEFEKGRYEIKIVPASGQMKEVYVDGNSGEVLRIEEKEDD